MPTLNDDVATLGGNVQVLATAIAALSSLASVTTEQRGQLATYASTAAMLAASASGQMLDALEEIQASVSQIETMIGGGTLIAPALVVSPGQVFAPTVTGGGAAPQTVSPSLVASAAAVYSPTVTPGGPPGQTVSPAVVASGSTVYQPTLTQTVAPYDGLVTTRTVMPDTVTASTTKYQMVRANLTLTSDIDVSTLRVWFANFYMSSETEVGNAGACVIRASYEPTLNGGTLHQFHFSSKPDTAGHPGDDTYGLIPAVPTLGSGGATIEGTHEGVIGSNALGVSGTRSKGERLLIRFWMNNNSGMIYKATGRDATNGDYFVQSASALTDATTSGSLTGSAGSTMCFPFFVTAMTTEGTVVIIGDSNNVCIDDEATFTVGGVTTVSDHRRGGVQRGIPLTTASLNLAAASAKAETVYAKSICRRVAWPFASHIQSNFGINDITANGRSAATVYGYQQTLSGYLAAHQKFIPSTLYPLSTSTTGHWGTVAGQTASPYASVINSYSDLVRAGAAWQDDYLELEDTVASSRGACKWAPPATYRAFSDLTIQVNVRTITSPTANFTAADRGLSLYLPGAGTSGTNLHVVITAVNSSTSIAISADPKVAFTGNGVGNLELTDDGLHSGARACQVPVADYVASVAATKFAYA